MSNTPSKLKKTIDVMIGFMWNQPIHKTLRQMRIIAILAICFCGWLIFDMWTWYKSVVDINKAGDVAFLGFAGVIVGAFWKAISNLQDQHKDDD